MSNELKTPVELRTVGSVIVPDGHGGIRQIPPNRVFTTTDASLVTLLTEVSSTKPVPACVLHGVESNAPEPDMIPIVRSSDYDTDSDDTDFDTDDDDDDDADIVFDDEEEDEEV